MAILKVARIGHPVLRCPAEPLPSEEIAAPATQRLIDDMLETMAEYDGVGLAGPQVHVSRRLVVYGVAANRRYPDAPAIPLTVLVNPRITPVGDDREDDMHARILQHEVDHLDGKVYLDRMPSMESLAFLAELQRYGLKRAD